MPTLINRDGVASLESGWRASYSWTKPTAEVYIDAPSFVIQMYGKSVALRKCQWQMEGLYWNGSQWVSAMYYHMVLSGKAEQTVKFGHNRSAESGYQSQVNNNFHHWMFRFSQDSVTGSSTNTFSCWVGGIGLWTAAEYDNLAKHLNDPTPYPELIRYVRGDYWGQGGNYANATAFLNGEKPSNWRGTPIKTANGKFCSTSNFHS